MQPSTNWFDKAGLGFFISWDHASQQGVDLSWPMVDRSTVPGIPGSGGPEHRMSVEQYLSSAATFNPVQWDARALVQSLVDAGATYIVFTTRHHNGYSMYFTDADSFSVEHSPFGRDITGELFDAARDAGLRIGVYYSLSHWSHEDYPPVRDEDLPYGNYLELRSSAGGWARYQHYLRLQLTELLTNYGEIDLLFFDGEWERTPEEWDVDGLSSLIRSLQPQVLINERLPGHGDYASPEQGFPRENPGKKWELCDTMGQMWGWNPADIRIRTARSLLVRLIEVVARGGNYLLNVSPNGEGSLPKAQVTRLNEFAGWMTRHRESVIGTTPAPSIDFYGPVTQRADRIFLHLVASPVEELIVRGLLVNRVSSVVLLQTGRKLQFTTHIEVKERWVTHYDQVGEIRIVAPNASGALVDVIAIALDLAPELNPSTNTSTTQTSPNDGFDETKGYAHE